MNINKHAIYHIADVPYAYGVEKDTLRVRIRVAHDEIDKCEVYFKDRYKGEDEYQVQEIEKRFVTDMFDYFEGEITLPSKKFKYNFKLTGCNREVLYFSERGATEEFNKDGGFQFPYICNADMYKSPDWLKEGIVYQIFPDRFCNGDEMNDPEGVLPWGEPVTTQTMFGGDIQGVIDKLDYLDDLGVDIIYFTPVFESTTNHKYNTRDYYKIDPQFGDVETVKELVKKAHEKNIKILFDAVFNHSGRDFFAFEDVIKNGEKSKYKDWFFIHDYPVDIEKINYDTFADSVSEMPKLNTENPEVVDYLLDVSEYWIKEVGIDGWRLDVCNEVDHKFWREFNKRVKKTNPEAIIIGEIMHESSQWLRGDQMDGIMHYPFRELVIDFFAKRKISSQEFIRGLVQNRVLYMDEINRNQFNLLDSHDTERYLTTCKEDINRLKHTMVFQYSYIGVPYIYYGGEVGMVGEGDPDCRRCMIWEEDKQNKEVLDLYKKLNRIRKENKVLIYGEFECLYSDDNVLITKMYNEKDCVITILNNNEEKKSIQCDELNGNYFDMLAEKEIKFDGKIDLDANEMFMIK
ncbi:glycoside hydrolase family 13 protein [Oceanirhabdus sp. W0125-5]|uniref:glycoside hydrolase family 13 protein n=1 Tax=Oceanirhabdus sp. W0125-5 TaxID=2999116 RepID=UPI0022F30A76|nr:glycoside hydrolase family 13 protein [Oceanirhabdus sp. W0125-5]WBW95509.1 glycoside hydrolase family 13 protein [Oceanirhabdus sp. W0125-5]